MTLLIAVDRLRRLYWYDIYAYYQKAYEKYKNTTESG